MGRRKSEKRLEAEFLCATRPNDASRVLASVLQENHGGSFNSSYCMIRGARGAMGEKHRDKATHPRSMGNAGKRKPPRTDKEILQDKIDQTERALLVSKDLERKTKRENERLKKELHERDVQIEEIIDTVPSFIPTVVKRRKKPRKSAATAVLLFSDLHYEEQVDPKTISGLNKYDRGVARDRVDMMVSKAFEQIEMFNTVHEIDELVIWLGGDHISGHIHPELMETCDLAPADAIAEVSEVIAGVVETFYRCELFRKIRLICNDGNHGRSTHKLNVSTRVGSSWETLMFRMLRTAFRNYKGMEWEIADGAILVTKIRDRNWRFLHGDLCRYQGGVGGLSIPVNKAIAQWDKAVPCYHTCMGHWHTRTVDRAFTVNGSVIGYSAYAMSIKASWEPPSQTLIIADEKGIRSNTALQLGDSIV